MFKSIRLAFLIPAILVAAPAAAQPDAAPKTHALRSTPIRYVTLDRMIREFAARAREEQSAPEQVSLEMKRATVLAQR